MLRPRSLNNLLNQIHERGLRTIYNDHVCSFEDMIEMSNGKAICPLNLEFLVKEIYKFVTAVLPLMNDVCTVQGNSLQSYKLPN